MHALARERAALPRFTLAAALATLLTVFPACAPAADDVPDEVRRKSAEFDVPFVPSHGNVLRSMFDMAKPTANDFLIDLGSGDGRIVITAAREFGLRGFGVDLNEELVAIAKRRAREAGVASRVDFHVRNLFETDIRPATILTMYLLPDVVQSLRDKLLTELRPGARIVSHDYHLGDWRPDAAEVVSHAPASTEESIVYFWVVPARVAGTWEWTIQSPYFDEPVAYTMALSQHFQDIDGKVTVFPSDQRIHDARLTGKRIAFSVSGELEERIVRHDFTGEVDGDRITGTVRLSGGVRPVSLPWTARRTRGAE